eukprot:scaffold663172_cov41-Prasinocladus_malaysianus.AAC.1
MATMVMMRAFMQHIYLKSLYSVCKYGLTGINPRQKRHRGERSFGGQEGGAHVFDGLQPVSVLGSQAKLLQLLRLLLLLLLEPVTGRAANNSDTTAIDMRWQLVL